jgi:ABC-type transport system involved in multi-copper enzyme maturation permease subunit
MRGMVRDTIVELVDRKALWVYLIVTAIGVATALLLSHFVVTTGSDNLDLNGAAGSTAETARRLHSGASALCSLLVFLSVMFTAGVFPQMLERGRAEYYLSKPITRVNLYLMKLTAVWLVYSTLIILCTSLVYATGAIANGAFDVGVLYLFGFVLFSLALWLSVSGFMGVVTGSTVTVVVVTILTWLAQFVFSNHEKINAIVTSSVLRTVIDGIYYILPKDSQIGAIEDALANGAPVESWLPVWSTAIFALVMLFLGLQIFKRKSY